MAKFHPLKVVDIRQETRDAVVLTLEAANGNMDEFSYVQGQYVTFRKEFDGEELRRSYSICSKVGSPFIQVGIKKVQGGVFSSWANDELKAGDVLEAMPPMGNFHVPISKGDTKHYLGFAGGSGITPFMSIIKTVLEEEPDSHFTLLYGNMHSHSIMFREELEDLKNIYLGRLSVIHVLERETQEIELFNGRIDKEKCAKLFNGWINLDDVDMAFICGPEPMMISISESLKEHGLAGDKIKFELFAPSKPSCAGGNMHDKAVADGGPKVEATIIIDGLSRNVEMPKDAVSILEAGLDAGMDLPYACKGGVCSTCKCKVVEGDVEMDTNHALEDYEVRAGYVLSCQSYPVSDKVIVDYDQ
ncbi:1,2-phenylacetyl-CoA epoxidase subunit PaaE [Curvivirga aplysinae]|uniref:1,2-phenylacetyl-CoA epoxidase subunit PaaE n=1 Tax=Curvivirga aplysinae TaxID=2529852 RepID=UPI0012BCA5FA|nr:1,2-phenylacetyl-CoA epoxidase subunit PaaE [Curvivirga aplysinae]MTI09868.1 phenylacetate-CoA oxygenase/reductase subunit PaaK [Curvivirga aplysinae]